MKGYCPGWASKALRPSFKNNTPVDVLTPSWCLGPSFENQEPARGSCAKTAQAAASPWFGEGSAADYWGTAGEPFLLSACSPNKENHRGGARAIYLRRRGFGAWWAWLSSEMPVSTRRLSLNTRPHKTKAMWKRGTRECFTFFWANIRKRFVNF